MKSLVKTIFWLVALYIGVGLFIALISQTSFRRFQVEHFYWSYDHHIIFLIGVPLLMVALKRSRATIYGLFFNRRAALSIVVILVLTVILPLFADAAQGNLAWKDAPPSYFLSALFFQLILSGCGEELFFRGLYQGELNRVCKRKWKVMGERFGPGLLIAALLFGFGHLGVVGWITSGSGLNLGSFLFTLTVGFALGFAREAVGCIIVVGFLHGAVDTYQTLVVPSQLGRIIHFMGLGTAFWMVLGDRFEIRKQDAQVDSVNQ